MSWMYNGKAYVLVFHSIILKYCLALSLSKYYHFVASPHSALLDILLLLVRYATSIHRSLSPRQGCSYLFPFLHTSIAIKRFSPDLPMYINPCYISYEMKVSVHNHCFLVLSILSLLIILHSTSSALWKTMLTAYDESFSSLFNLVSIKVFSFLSIL